ncbi:hypothetical protein [uncultured Treponema sp.]|uniref:hypothetical protein n=1 Tax=uncultured Treponema sp. TaxID=162155 RepID=UPI0025D60545|nr:hypothetical protein [uncultured Treponema sp.]
MICFNKKIINSVILSSILFLASCSKNNAQLELQSLSPSELSPRIEWALIADPYVACRKDASYESATISSFRKGEIHEIKGNRTVVVDEETKELWYAIEDGWIPSYSVKVYSNKLKAEAAKKELK